MLKEKMKKMELITAPRTSSVEWNDLPAAVCHFCTVFVCFQETFKNAFVSQVNWFIFLVQ